MSEFIEDVVYGYALVSGGVVVEISGAVKLHSVIVNRGTSGKFYTVYDSAVSGRFLSAGASVVGIGYCGNEGEVPKTVNYDARLHSGLVIIASGANWLLNVTYK